MDLQDKRALITGGTSGMGIATALAMAENRGHLHACSDVFGPCSAMLPGKTAKWP